MFRAKRKDTSSGHYSGQKVSKRLDKITIQVLSNCPLVTGKTKDDSDIDIGIKGLPKGKFFEVYSKLYFSLENEIDLVNFDANSDFHSMLDKIGEVIQIG